MPLDVWMFPLREISSKCSCLGDCSGICPCVPGTVIGPLQALGHGCLTTALGEGAHLHFQGGPEVGGGLLPKCQGWNRNGMGS